jgi:hypothetical protein
MKTSDLVFVGIKGTVLALDRATGLQVWATHLKGADFVNVVQQDDAVFASCHGEVFCLDPLTGAGLWHNRLKGFGIGLATIAVPSGAEAANSTAFAEKRRRDEAAAAAGSVAGTAAVGG